MQGQLYEFASKYWNFIDQDGSGGLNFNEFKYTFAGFAAVDSRVIMKAFDADNNGLLGYYFFWNSLIIKHIKIVNLLMKINLRLF